VDKAHEDERSTFGLLRTRLGAKRSQKSDDGNQLQDGATLVIINDFGSHFR
jgi:hypothetical protein